MTALWVSMGAARRRFCMTAVAAVATSGHRLQQYLTATNSLLSVGVASSSGPTSNNNHHGMSFLRRRSTWHSFHRFLTTVRGGGGSEDETYRIRTLLKQAASNAELKKEAITLLVEWHPTFSPSERREVLHYLAVECNSTTSKDFFQNVLEQPKGSSYLIEIQKDLMHSISTIEKHKNISVEDEKLLPYLKHVKSILRLVLTEHLFGPQQQLTCQLLQYDTISAEILAEASVHRLTDELQKQFGPTKRVFGLFYQQHPVVILYVSLQPCIPASMQEIYQEKADTDKLTVAALYSISNLQAGLAGFGLGELLIRNAVEHFQKHLSDTTVDTFVTLSPMPGFRTWLCSQISENKTSFTSLFGESHESVQFLSTEWNCPADQVLQRMLEELLAREEHGDELTATVTCVNNILTRAAAHYICHAKLHGKPVDGVARFHLQNGATAYRINAGADPSKRGWRNSFGVMMNYHYNLADLSKNKARYKAEHKVAVHENVAELLN